MDDLHDVISTTNHFIVDMGEVTGRAIDQLKRGEGKLNDEVNEIIDEIADQLKDKINDKTFLPVVVIYERKSG